MSPFETWTGVLTSIGKSFGGDHFMTDKAAHSILGLPVGVAMWLGAYAVAAVAGFYTMKTELAHVVEAQAQARDHGERLVKMETLVPRLETALKDINKKLDDILDRKRADLR